MGYQGNRMDTHGKKSGRLAKWIWIVVACAVVVIAVALGVFFRIRSSAPETSPASQADVSTGENVDLAGVWAYSEYTRYTFYEDGTGSMQLDDMEFPYQYRVDGDQLYLDFESDSLLDATYTYTLEGTTLTIEGGEGTTGGTYQLTREE